MEYVKSPFNYIGGKFKLLPLIVPLFPKKINMFYDVFGGGANVSLNVNSEYTYYNDIVSYVGETFKELKGMEVDKALEEIHKIINKYKLSKTNRDGFETLRRDYNNGFKTWASFYVLTCYSFNYQFRFNNNHEYNSSFGVNRSSFSSAMEKRFSQFLDRLNNLDISIDSKDFREIDFSDTDSNDFVYLDPPYLITTGNYNDGKRGFKGWNKSDDEDLFNLCDRLNDRGVRFAMSNVIESNGQVNDRLENWSDKYKVHNIKHSYSNSNYQRKDKGLSKEVLITNY